MGRKEGKSVRDILLELIQKEQSELSYNAIVDKTNLNKGTVLNELTKLYREREIEREKGYDSHDKYNSYVNLYFSTGAVPKAKIVQKMIRDVVQRMRLKGIKLIPEDKIPTMYGGKGTTIHSEYFKGVAAILYSLLLEGLLSPDWLHNMYLVSKKEVMSE